MEMPPMKSDRSIEGEHVKAFLECRAMAEILDLKVVPSNKSGFLVYRIEKSTVLNEKGKQTELADCLDLHELGVFLRGYEARHNQ